MGITIHILISSLAFGTLAIAALQSLILSWQERQLRRGQLKGLLAILPPMQTTEQILFEIIGLGAALLAGQLATARELFDFVLPAHGAR